MTTEQLTDAERKLIIGLLIDALPTQRRARPLMRLIKLLSGTDTRVIVERPDARQADQG